VGSAVAKHFCADAADRKSFNHREHKGHRGIVAAAAQYKICATSAIHPGDFQE
jgi:hypothetical protein